jgi:hypothetical protein
MSLVPIFPFKGEQISEALVLRRSEAGRFAYNLRVPRTPTRPHADTPTQPLGGCGSAALWDLWFAPHLLSL